MINRPGISSITIGGVTQYGGSVEFNVPGAAIDPGTGEITLPTGSAQASVSFTLVAQDITNKYILLPSTPSEPTKTKFECDGLATQYYGLDYEVTSDNDGKRVSWANLGLEPLLEIGDYIVIYFS